MGRGGSNPPSDTGVVCRRMVAGCVGAHLLRVRCSSLVAVGGVIPRAVTRVPFIVG